MFTATDACGNTATTTATFTVNDTQNPVAPEAPATVTVACTSEIPSMIALTATDNCSNTITVEGVDSIAQGDCANSFVVTRTWTFVDACGNTSAVSQTINVNDNVAPVAPEAPATITVACAGDVPAMVALTAQENCIVLMDLHSGSRHIGVYSNFGVYHNYQAGFAYGSVVHWSTGQIKRTYKAVS